MYSDASYKGLGYILMQHGKVVAYVSRQLRSYEQLSNSRFGTCCDRFRPKDLEALLIWREVRHLYGSLKSQVLIFPEGAEHKTKTLDKTSQRLRL